MKVQKFVVLLLAILFPLIVTGFIGMYSYGLIGNWTKNQENFVETIFNNKAETTTSIDNYMKFSASHYKKNISNLKIYSDYEKQTEAELVNGVYEDTNKAFSLASYASGEINGDSPYINYPFFIYNINYEKVNPANIRLIAVRDDSDALNGSYQNLLDAIDYFKDEFLETSLTGSAAITSERSNSYPAGYPIYDIHATLASSEDEKTPYAYSLTPVRNYTFTDENGYADTSAMFPTLGTAHFAIMEVIYDENDEKAASDVKVLLTGTLSEIKKSINTVASLDDVNLGYGTLDNIKALQQAGYTNYIMFTVAWQAAIALVITTVISVLFYLTWTYEEPATNKKIKATKK